VTNRCRKAFEENGTIQHSDSRHLAPGEANVFRSERNAAKERAALTGGNSAFRSLGEFVVKEGALKERVPFQAPRVVMQ